MAKFIIDISNSHPELKDAWKLFEELAYRRAYSQVFSDLIERMGKKKRSADPVGGMTRWAHFMKLVLQGLKNQQWGNILRRGKLLM